MGPDPHESRFTPTGVGTTYGMPFHRAKLTVHPHGRGDHVARLSIEGSGVGSPPRAWGPRKRHRIFLPNFRFTPTGVGTTLAISTPPSVHSVHPHGRGDHFPAPGRSSCCSGSPPRAWGPQSPETSFRLLHRFTPTGVGTTICSRKCVRVPTVHPHGRGDHGRRGPPMRSPAGSPPRAWGPLKFFSYTRIF